MASEQSAAWPGGTTAPDESASIKVRHQSPQRCETLVTGFTRGAANGLLLVAAGRCPLALPRLHRRVLALVFASLLLLGLPSTAAAADCRFVSAPFPPSWSPHPVFPGCFFVLVGWLLCFGNGNPPTPDEPPDSPTVTPVFDVACYVSTGCG